MFKLDISPFISSTEYVLREDTIPSHKTKSGTIGIKYVKIILPILNGRIKGVVYETLIGEKIIAMILGKLLSCASKIAMALLVSTAFCRI